MRKLFTYIFLLIGLASLSISVCGFDSLERVRFHGFDGEGCFVEGPSYAGSSTGYVFGILPAAIITEPQRILNYDQDSDRLGVSILSGYSKTFSVLFGVFPYLLKKGFWDFPKWIVVGSDKNSDYYELKPAPVPEVKADPRLLREEKHADLNMQDNTDKPVLIEIPEVHKRMQAGSIPELKTMKEVKSISEQTISVKQIPLPEDKTASDAQGKITLHPIPSSTVTDTSIGNISGGYSIDTERGEDNSQKWESSGLPDWVKKQVTQ
jgi:hypothetical protein